VQDQPLTSTYGSFFDLYPYFGRVLYTYGMGVDQPLGVTRFAYTDRTIESDYFANGLQAGSFYAPGTFTLFPMWDQRGQPLAGGSILECRNVAPTNGRRCVKTNWRPVYLAYYRNLDARYAWHGSLLEEKVDGSGQLYRRNRYYDPLTGRFTQEDPVGLGGGLNLYGYAGGDPVGYSDPYGLSPTDVIVEGEHARAVIAYLRNHSPSFDRLYRALDADHSIRVRVVDLVTPFQQTYGKTGFTPPARENDSGIIRYDLAENPEANRDYQARYGRRFTWQFTPMSSIAHEFGHAGAYYGKIVSGLEPACAGDPAPGSTGCIVDFENRIRHELPEDHRGGERTFY
jgi:RHS repeat-associated protein